MESPQTRIGEILKNHSHLMIAYEQILKEIEGNKIFNKLFLNMDNPRFYFKQQNIGLVEKFQLCAAYASFLMNNKSVDNYFKFICSTIFSKILFLKNILFKKIFSKTSFSTMSSQQPLFMETIPEKERYFNPLVHYLLKTHIRRQLSILHRLYLREILTQNILKNKEEIDEFRQINSTVKEYIKELPDIRRFFVTLIGLGLGLVTTIFSLGIGKLFAQIILSDVTLFVIIITMTPIIVSFAIVEIFTKAFRIKRSKLLNTKSFYPCYDLYFEDGKKIYENSVYKLEDTLYEKLDKKNQKPREIPVDLILQFIMPGIFILFVTALIIIAVINSIISGTQIPTGVEYLLPFMLLLVFIFSVIPVLRNRRRMTNNLH